MTTVTFGIFITLAIFCKAGAISQGAIVSGPSGTITRTETGSSYIQGSGHGYDQNVVPAASIYNSGSDYGWEHDAVQTQGAGVGEIGSEGHGITVNGPASIPAVIAGPAGKIITSGGYGPSNYGHY